MIKAYKYRVYPSAEQSRKIDSTISVCRFVYNLALETKIYAYKSHGINLTAIDLCYQLSDLKKDNDWLKNVDSQALQSSIKILDKSFRNFFKGAGFPKFKNKKSKQSFTCHNNTRRIDFENQTLTIPKIKNIPIRIDRIFNGMIKSVTISKTPTGKYFASVLVEDGKEMPSLIPINLNKAIGIDTGIKNFVVTSDGRSFEANRKLKENLRRLNVLQRRASKKKIGSQNKKKANLRVALLYEKITNKRLDYIHKVSKELTRDNQAISTIFIEDLNLSGLLKNHNIAQAMQDVSLGKFYEVLAYKCAWSGINLIKIGRFAPSSKRCSCCGNKNNNLTLKDREWTCDLCGTNHDRDLNASQNILWYGKEKYYLTKSGRGSSKVPVELPKLIGTEKQEEFQAQA